MSTTLYSLVEYSPQSPDAGVTAGWHGVSPAGKMLTACTPAHIVEQRHLKIVKIKHHFAHDHHKHDTRTSKLLSPYFEEREGGGRLYANCAVLFDNRVGPQKKAMHSMSTLSQYGRMDKP